MDFETDPVLNAVQHINNIIESEEQGVFKSRVHHSVQVIEECLDKYRCISHTACTYISNIRICVDKQRSVM